MRNRRCRQSIGRRTRARIGARARGARREARGSRRHHSLDEKGVSPRSFFFSFPNEFLQREPRDDDGDEEDREKK